MGGGISREPYFGGYQVLIAEIEQDWGKQRLILGGHTQSSVHIRTQGEGAVTP